MFASRLRAHFGTDPNELPIVAEQFEPSEHPNLQVALDAWLAREGRWFEAVGVTSEFKRFNGLGLADVLTSGGSGLAGRSGPVVGPVEYVNVALDGGRVVTCLQFGLLLIGDAAQRLAVLVCGPTERGIQANARVEVMAPDRDQARRFLADVRAGMRAANVYRGRVVSLAQDHYGILRIRFHALPDVARQDIVLADGLTLRLDDFEGLVERTAGARLRRGRGAGRSAALAVHARALGRAAAGRWGTAGGAGAGRRGDRGVLPGRPGPGRRPAGTARARGGRARGRQHVRRGNPRVCRQRGVARRPVADRHVARQRRRWRLLYGARSWRGRRLLRFAVLNCLLGCGLALAALAAGPYLLGVALALAGLLVAPIATESSLLIDAVAPRGTVTEAFAWLITAVVVGTAAGSAAAGLLVERLGGGATLLAAAAAPASAGLVTWLRRAS